MGGKGMPPPSASAAATRLAAYWTADALAADEAFHFSVLQDLVRTTFPKSLAGAPEPTRQRLALRGLHEAITAEATPGPQGLHHLRSCQDVLRRLITDTQVASSGNCENDLLPPFSQDILESVRTTKHTLPETSFQLLKGLDPQVISMDPPSQLKHNGTEQCDNAGVQQETMENLVNESETGNLQSARTSVLHQPCTPDSRSYAPPQEDTIDAVGLQGTTMISHPQSSKAHLGALQNESGDKLQAASVLLSLSCNGAIQGSKSGTSLQAGNATEDTMVFEEQNAEKSHFQVRGANKANQTQHGDVSILKNDMVHSALQGSKSGTNLQPGNATDDTVVSEEQNADKSHLDVSSANKANQTLHDDVSILKNNMVHGGLTAQTAPVSQNCNVTLHGKTSEANCFPEQKNEKRRTDVKNDNGHTSIPSSFHDGDGESAKKTSNEEKFEDTSPEIDINDTPEGLSLQDVCIKCGKDGQLLKCGECLLVAHDSCFCSSVTFEETDLFCPVCIHKKATEAYKNAKKTYHKAKKNLAAFVDTTQVVKQHEEQLNGVQRGAAKRDGHLNGSEISKRNSIHQDDAYEQLAGVQSGAANRDDHSTRSDMSKRKSINQHEAYNPESGEQRKKQKTDARGNGNKQKTNARGNGYPKEALTEKVPFPKSGLASMNKHSVLQNNNNTRVNSSEKEQQVGDKEACKESGNGNLSHEARAASANQDVETDRGDGPAAHYQSGGYCQKNDSGKRPKAPWCNMIHMRTSPTKKHYARKHKRYRNPVGPVGRRQTRFWKKEEEDCLREAMKMEEFTPKDGERIPWVKILEYGRDVFERTRLPGDLRVKWRSMNLADK